jgi:hypothetical protein
MIEILENIVVSDDAGTHTVPVAEYNAPLVGNLSLCAPDEGRLPKIDVYKYNDLEYELFAWTATAQQMFQITEQILLLFNPHLGHKHPYFLKGINRGSGTVLEFNCKIGKRNA